MEKTSLIHIEDRQWVPIYRKIKNENTYKFMYSDIDNYVRKIGGMLGHNLKYPSALIKKTEHSKLVYEIKANFMRVISDVNMLDLPNLAMCLQYVIQKLIDSLKELFMHYVSCANAAKDLHASKTIKNLGTDLCLDCQMNICRKNVDNLMTSMTIGDNKPAARQIKAVTDQIQELATDYGDIELSIMIDEILQHKDVIFNVKKHQTNNIYDQIAQYLESIPQSVINLSRQNREVDQVELLQVSNISGEIQSVLNQIIQKPIRKLIKRVIQYTKAMYRPGQHVQNSSQTPYSEDCEKIKALEKEKITLKAQIEKIRELKRQSEREMISMIDQQKNIEIKYSELYSKHTCLSIDHETMKKQFEQTKEKLARCQFGKKELSDRLIGDYSQEKSVFLKTIKELKSQYDSVSTEFRKLKKQTQDLMVTTATQIEYQNFYLQAEVQTQHHQEYKDTQNIRFGKSKRNSIMRFMSIAKGESQKDKQEADYVIQPNSMIQSKITDKDQRNEKKRNEEKETKESREILIKSKRKNSKRDSKKFGKIGLDQERQKKKYEQKSVKSGKKMQRMVTTEKINEKRQEKSIGKQHSEFYEQIAKKSAQFFSRKKESVFFNSSDERSVNRRDKILSRIGIDEEFFTAEENRKEAYNGISIIGYAQKNRDSNNENKDRHSSSIDLNRLPTQNKNPNYLECPSPLRFVSQRHHKQILSIPVLQAKHFNETWNHSGNILNPSLSFPHSERRQIIDKIYQNYQLLQRKKIFEKIKQIIELAQQSQANSCHKINNKSPMKRDKRKSLLNHKQVKSCLEEEVKISNSTFLGHFKVRNQQIVFERKSARENLKVKKLAHMKEFNNFKPSFNKTDILTLFISEKYLYQYQKSEDIWGVLNGSISIDFQNNVVCSKILSFFKQMEKENQQAYLQCWNLLHFPSHILNPDRKGDHEQQLLDKKTSKTDKRSKFMIKIRNYGDKENEMKSNLEQKSPEKLKQIIKKLFSFHRLIHKKKCRHVLQFMQKLGFNQK